MLLFNDNGKISSPAHLKINKINKLNSTYHSIITEIFCFYDIQKIVENQNLS